MNHLEFFLAGLSLSLQVALVAGLFVRSTQRRLPFFTAYVCVIATTSIAVAFTYARFGISSAAAYYAYWYSIVLNAIARSFAIVELCRYGLRKYVGIWALVWHILVVLSVLLCFHLVIDAWAQPHGISIYASTFDRDLALASVVILAALFFMRGYYGLALDGLQRKIALGICLICTVDVIGNTIFRSFLTGNLLPWFLPSQKALWPMLQPQLRRLGNMWDTVHLLVFMFTLGIWLYALRKPLTAPTEAPELLPAHIYREMSPAINMRLASFNERLTELLKP